MAPGAVKKPRMCTDCEIRYAQELGRCRHCWALRRGNTPRPAPRADHAAMAERRAARLRTDREAL